MDCSEADSRACAVRSNHGTQLLGYGDSSRNRHQMKLVVGSVVSAMVLASFVLAQDHPAGTTETDRLLYRIGERINQYYTNLQTVSWNNKVRVEVLKEDLTQKERPREFVYDVIIRLQEPTAKTDPLPFAVREIEKLLSIDGKAARKDQTAKQ